MGNELVTKEVNFNGDVLKAVKNESDGKIYVGVSWVCNGIGFTKGQKDRQVLNVQSDLVLKSGCFKFEAGVFDNHNETLAIELDYLPLWLAKISITPKMQSENSLLVKKLVSYQLKAKDVLAQAFIKPKEVDFNNFNIPSTLSEALLLSANLAKENEVMKPKAEQFDLYLDCDGTLSFNQSAKALKTGRNKLMAYLRHKNVLNLDNSPSSYYADKNYFQTKAYTYVTQYGNQYQTHTTRITTEGQDFLFRFLKKNIKEYSNFDYKFQDKFSELGV